MRIKDTELKAVLAAIEDDLNKAFDAKKEDLLAKAVGDDKPDDAPAEASDSDPADAGPASADSSSPAASPAPDASAAPASPAPDAAGAPADPAAQQGAPLTPEALQAEYSQLAPEELDMHIKAALAAKEALMASAAPADPAAAGMPPAPGASPAPAGPPAPASPSPAGPPAMKAELPDAQHKKANGGHEGAFPKISKSELDERDAKIAALESLIKSQNEKTASQSEDIENLTKAIKMVLERPERKAVTSVAALVKSEPVTAKTDVKKVFTPAEARARLNELIPTLSKAERETVHDFYAGKVDASRLDAILEKATK